MGLKIMCLADAKSSFLYKAYIYTGKNSDGMGLSAKEQTLSKLLNLLSDFVSKLKIATVMLLLIIVLVAWSC